MSNNSLSIEFRVSDIRQIMADNDTSILFVCFIRTVWGRFFVVVFFYKCIIFTCPECWQNQVKCILWPWEFLVFRCIEGFICMGKLLHNVEVNKL